MTWAVLIIENVFYKYFILEQQRGKEFIPSFESDQKKKYLDKLTSENAIIKEE